MLLCYAAETIITLARSCNHCIVFSLICTDVMVFIINNAGIFVINNAIIKCCTLFYLMTDLGVACCLGAEMVLHFLECEQSPV